MKISIIECPDCGKEIAIGLETIDSITFLVTDEKRLEKENET